jgi:hypothetical protein
VLKVARNSTFHYPKAGDRALVEVLTDLANHDFEGEIVCGEKMPSMRAQFADLAMLNLALNELGEPKENAYAQLATALSETVIAIAHLAERAIYLRLDERDDVTWEEIPPPH